MPPSPRRKHTEVVGRYRVFDVLRHEMADADGAPLGQAFTFRCPDWVSIVPVTGAGQLVLVRQYRHGIDAPTIEVPGGVIDAGEEPAAAAVRELREETGYEANALRSLGFSHPNPPLQDNRHFMYLAEGVEARGAPSFDVGEHCELVLASADEVRGFIARGELTHALVLVALARAFDALAGRG